MHVVKFFNSLLETPHIEVVKSPLPKPPRPRIFNPCKVQIQLSSDRPFFVAQAARDSLFQNLDHHGGRSFGRFADEQMNVLRHHDISDKREPVAVPDFAENLNESVSGANRSQKRHTPVATERNEMKMAAPVNPNEFVGHGVQEHQNPDPSRIEGSATRKSQTSHPALTYWSGIIQACSGVKKKIEEGCATRLAGLNPHTVSVETGEVEG